MKYLIFIIVAIILFSFFSCGGKNEHETNKIFNEGVSLNLESISAQEKGDFERAISLNKKSIEKFREVLKVDSTNPVIRSALAHSLYIDKQFPEAIYWFEQANKIDGGAAVNYRELGLCKISIGKMKEGKNDIDKAFMLDTTVEIRNITVKDLADIGELAFSYGDGYVEQGEIEKAKDYKKLSLGVLIMAYNYDNSQKGIAGRIAELADKFDDKETAAYYKTESTK